jgi:hypothetical protein
MGRVILIAPLSLIAWHAVPAQIWAGEAPTERTELVGADLKTWRKPHGDWQVVGDVRAGGEGDRFLVGTPGQGVMINGGAGRTTNILSVVEHGDVRAHIEFVVPKGSNSGVYFQGRYEVQILDSWGAQDLKHGDCGGIYQRWKDGRGFEGHPPRENASRPPGQWQSFDVVFRAPRFDAEGNKTDNARFVKVTHNGVVVHENVPVTGPTRAATYSDERPTGPIMLQGDHGPVAYRNIWIEPTNLD